MTLPPRSASRQARSRAEQCAVSVLITPKINRRLNLEKLNKECIDNVYSSAIFLAVAPLAEQRR